MAWLTSIRLTATIFLFWPYMHAMDMHENLDGQSCRWPSNGFLSIVRRVQFWLIGCVWTSLALFKDRVELLVSGLFWFFLLFLLLFSLRIFALVFEGGFCLICCDLWCDFRSSHPIDPIFHLWWHLSMWIPENVFERKFTAVLWMNTLEATDDRQFCTALWPPVYSEVETASFSLSHSLNVNRGKGRVLTLFVYLCSFVDLDINL